MAFVVTLTLFATSHAQEGTAIQGPILRGHVQGPSNTPIKDATVFIYSAGPKTGTSTYCPTCYPDCAKSAGSDGQGEFFIAGLSSELIFCVLLVAKGYRPQFVDQVDPALKSLAVTLAPLPLDSIPPAQILRAKITDGAGTPIRGAVVEAFGIFESKDRGHWGALEGVDPFAVTDEKGEFVITSQTAFVRMDVRVMARGFANRTVTGLVGGRRQSLVLTEGATVTGRVVLNGRPQPGVSVGVVSVDRGMENFTGHFEVATDASGNFAFYNLPPKVDYYVYGLMESVGKLGSVPLTPVRAGADGKTTKTADLAIGPGHRVSGRVILADGDKLPSDIQLLLSREDAWDSVRVKLDAEGRFDIRGVPSETVGLSVAVRGYRTSAKNRSFDVLNGLGLTGRVDRDVVGIEVLLEKGKMLRSDNRNMTEEQYKALPGHHPLRGAENLSTE